jgi:hypothetical protein
MRVEERKPSACLDVLHNHRFEQRGLSYAGLTEHPEVPESVVSKEPEPVTGLSEVGLPENDVGNTSV